VIGAEGGRNGPWTGICFHEGAFYVGEGGVLEGGRLLRITDDGAIRPIVADLPSKGDHHTNGPVVGPDGWLWFGQGTATNSGVVGEDNAKFGWLERFPDFHDVPGQDIELAGKTFATDGVAPGGGPPGGGPADAAAARRRTGGFAPFGASAERVAGSVPCSGSIMRVRPDGSGLELVAWGFRNPFGLAFAPDGRLYATDNGYDERGSRPVWGAADHLFEVRPGVWYGWPDWSGDRPLTEEEFQPPGADRIEFLLAEHPNKPPAPVAIFGVHSSANGLDFSRSAAFGHEGDAFVALFGDETPATGKLLAPVGFKVVRVDVESGLVHDFAVNRGATSGPASWLRTGGLERPVAVRFDPSGTALYVVDFGAVPHDDDGARPQRATGVVWRITRAR
jgi:glucose/arabinose dehydrogenase